MYKNCLMFYSPGVVAGADTKMIFQCQKKTEILLTR
jgi:hypothetical protein